MIVFALLIIAVCVWAISEARRATEAPEEVEPVEEHSYSDWQWPSREGR